MKIKKSKMDSFIEKYNLNGTIEKVKLSAKSDNSTLNVVFVSDTKTLLGKLSMTGFSTTEDIEVAIGETTKLKNFLKILSNEIDIDFNKADDGRIVAIKLSDENYNMNFMTSELSSIGSAPSLKNIPTFTIEIKVNIDFVKRFVKAEGALSDVDTFTLVKNEKTNKLDMIIGYSGTINSNKIKIEVDMVPGKDTTEKSVNFSAKYLKNIFAANSDFFTDNTKTATLFVSEKGLANITFESDGFKSEYYLSEIKTK